MVDWAVDSSTFFYLGIDNNTFQPMKDSENGKFPVLISGKLANSSDINGLQLRPNGDLPGKPFLRFGWHDFSDTIEFKSLHGLLEYTNALKHELPKINFTSSILLIEAPK